MVKQKRVPKFYGFRVYFTSTLLYFLLVMPFAAFLFLQNLPYLQEKKNLLLSDNRNNENIETNKNPAESMSSENQQNDSVQNNTFTINIGSGGEENTDTTREDNLISNSLSFLIKCLAVSFIIGFIFNLPFKRYFRRKRKRKRVSDRLFSFCKKYLLISPWINVGILGISYIASLINMVVIIYSTFSENYDSSEILFTRYFFISLFSSLLTILFVYFWEKHRVHIKYIDFLYSKKELRKRVFKMRVGRIKNRFWISNAMTTLLPLSIVIIYLIFSLTQINDLNLTELNKDHQKILFGNYPELFKTMNLAEDFGDLAFVNAIDSLIMFIGIGVGIFVSLIYLLLFVKWTTQDIVQPLKELLYNMQKTGEGKTVHYSVVRNNDEIGELTEGYNEMTKKIEDHISNISKLNEAYYRFVPRQFLEFLEKESITDVSLGDQIQKEMSILFTDIRDFTSLSEEMTPKENFDFLNEYLSAMEPVISRNKGFIDKYIGDSIMALFVGKVENAIDAAIEMRSSLADFNLQRKLESKISINSGIGIHTGNLMLGIVGGHSRMDGTVVSDAVNLASRIEGLTKIYRTSIIISQDTLIQLQDPGRYNYRFLDVVKVKGKKEAVYIFEILDGEPKDIKTLKIETKLDFGKGLQLYKNKEFDNALKIFKSINKINPDDQAASLYIARCKNILEFGVPENWDGVETIKYQY